MVDEIPHDITILKQPIKEPYGLANLFSKKSSKTISSGVIPKAKKQSFIEKLMLYIRGNYFIPDARKHWIKPSVAFLSNYIKEHQIDKIITTGPPHSLHLIGLQLKTKLDIKWIADFRDPWTTIGYHKDLKLTASQVCTMHACILDSNNYIKLLKNRKFELRMMDFKTNKYIR